MTAAPSPRARPTGRSPAAARKRRRLWVVAIALALLALATGLILTAFRDSIVFFYTPSEVAEKSLPAGRAMRLGGLVEDGSVSRTFSPVCKPTPVAVTACLSVRCLSILLRPRRRVTIATRPCRSGASEAGRASS